MRHAAQRTLEMQGCLPADPSTLGYPLAIGAQQAINRAFDAWQKRRGITTTSGWKKRVWVENLPKKAPVEKKEKPVKAPREKVERPVKVVTAETLEARRQKRLEARRRYNRANKARAAEWQRARRAAMTPEEKKEMQRKCNEYRKQKRLAANEIQP